MQYNLASDVTICWNSLFSGLLLAPNHHTAFWWTLILLGVYTADYLLETAPDLGFCGKFCSLLWLFLVSCLDSSIFSKDSFWLPSCLVHFARVYTLYLTYVWMVPKSIYSDLPWTSDPNFQQPPGNVCKKTFQVPQTQQVLKYNTLSSTFSPTFPPSGLSISGNGNTMDQV